VSEGKNKFKKEKVLVISYLKKIHEIGYALSFQAKNLQIIYVVFLPHKNIHPVFK
jgi:hypothetical protein